MRYIYKKTGIILGIILIFSLVITTTVYGEGYININNYGKDLEIDGTKSVYKIEGKGSENSTTNKIKVTAMEGDFTIYLKDVHIDVSGSAYNVAFLIKDESKANITIILEGENILKSGSEKAGLQKNTDLGDNSGKLIIDGEGKLSVHSSYIGAGIGGSTTRNTANIEIKGGTIIAVGGSTGIGGGAQATGSYITISGGNVIATGTSGIGGGKNGEYITISGGTVTATGRGGGAGIGGGSFGSGKNIEITGGTVTATGSRNSWYGGAGIGGGEKGTSSNIIISGGTINAIGGDGDNNGGAGIGSGGNAKSENITISGGTINATGGKNNVGIGGEYADNITITGGDIIAIGKNNKPGIGSYGNDTTLQGTTTINGNAVVTTEGGAPDTNVNHEKGVYVPKNVGSVENRVIKGDVTLNEDTTLPENVNIVLEAGSSLTISQGKTLTIPNGTTIINKGTIKVYSEDQIIKIETGKLTHEGGQLQIIEGDTPTQSTITLNYGSDIIGGQLTGGGTFNNGSEITVVATEFRGYKFLNWTKNGETISDKEYTFIVENDVELVANYRNKHEYTINLSVEPNDKGTVNILRPDSTPYYEDDDVVIEATPKNNYRFKKWEKTVNSETSDITESQHSFILENNVSFKAIFEYIKKEIDFEVLEAANGEANTETTTELNLTLTPNSEVNPNVQIDLSLINIELEGANVKENTSLTSIEENKYKLEIDNVEVIEGGKVKVKLTSDEYNFTPSEKEVSIHVKDIDVNITNIEANGEDNNITTNKLTIDLDKEIDINNLEVTVSDLTVGDLSINGTQLIVPVSGITENNQNVTVGISKPGYKFNIDNPNVIVYKSPIKYSIELSVNNGNYGAVSGDGEFPVGENITVTAMANDGYKFINWTENNEEVSAEKDFTFTVEGERTLVANFRPLEEYTLRLNSNPTEGGNLEIIEPTEEPYYEDSTVKVKATENTGYEFLGWYEGETLKSEESQYEFEITKDTTLIGKFKKLDEVVNVESITPNGESNVETTTELIITLDKEVEITADDIEITGATKGEVTSNGNNITVKISGITENNQNVTVNISKEGYSFTIENPNVTVYKAPNKYNINININPTEGGSVTGAENVEYIAGTDLSLEATANTGYTFIKWIEEGESLGTESTLNITVNSDRDITAKFQETGSINYYNITATANPTNGGTIENAGTYGENSNVIIKAVANSGYKFKEWQEDEVTVSTDKDYNFEVTRDRNLVAIFEEIEEEEPIVEEKFTITAVADPIEGGMILGAGEFEKDREITLSAIANENYEFVKWTENNEEISTESNLDITVTENRDLVAVFKEKETVEPIDPEEDEPIEDLTDPEEGEPITEGPVDPEDETVEYKVTFNSNGGNLDIRVVETVGGKLLYLPIPVRENYVFTGWFTKDGIRWDENNPVNKDMTLIANWRYEYIPEKPIKPVIPTPNYIYTENLDWLIFGETNSSTTSITEPKSTLDDIPVLDEPTSEENLVTDMSKFIDVPENSFFKKAVDWAVENGITTGTTEITFSPYEQTTRAETVAFLWRAAGMPEPTITESPFTDISEGEYYYKAVLWAYENGITTGVTENEFAPGEIVTRGEAVTFQWRAGGEVPGSGQEFADVKSDAFYEEAVSWAVENEITLGTGEATFSPDRNVTRGEIVTLLYRQLGK